MIAISVGKIMLLLDTSSLMIIHLGENPVSGGSPPRDINTMRIIEVNKGDLFQELDRASVDVFLL